MQLMETGDIKTSDLTLLQQTADAAAPTKTKKEPK
jgi:hypothetical protein